MLLWTSLLSFHVGFVFYSSSNRSVRLGAVTSSSTPELCWGQAQLWGSVGWDVVWIDTAGLGFQVPRKRGENWKLKALSFPSESLGDTVPSQAASWMAPLPYLRVSRTFFRVCVFPLNAVCRFKYRPRCVFRARIKSRSRLESLPQKHVAEFCRLKKFTLRNHLKTKP